MLRYLQKTDKLWPLVALGFAYVLLSSLWSQRENVIAEIDKQYYEARALNLMRMNYDNPAHIDSRWREVFPDRTKVDDLLSLYRLFGLKETGLGFELDEIQVRSIELETPYIGITRVCLANKDTKFVLTAEDFHGLARGLVTLAKRTELRLDPMRIQWLDDKPAAIMDDFCILLRDPPRG